VGMSCDCSMDTDNCGLTELYNSSFPKARKKHMCCECREVIKVGETYERVSGKWDGIFMEFKTCLACVRIREHYCPNGFVFESLKEQLMQCLGFDYTEVPEGD